MSMSRAQLASIASVKPNESAALDSEKLYWSVKLPTVEKSFPKIRRPGGPMAPRLVMLAFAAPEAARAKRARTRRKFLVMLVISAREPVLIEARSAPRFENARKSSAWMKRGPRPQANL